MPGKPLQAGLLESGLASLADRRTTALVLVVGRHIADPGVQPHAVVTLADHAELGAQHGRVADGQQVRPLGLDVAEQRLDPGLVGRGAGPPQVLMYRAQRHELAGGARGHLRPVVAQGSSTGRDGSSTVRSTRPSWRAATRSSRPSRSNASVKTTWTWVEVSSAETISANHLRDTRSSTTVAAMPALVK